MSRDDSDSDSVHDELGSDNRIIDLTVDGITAEERLAAYDEGLRDWECSDCRHLFTLEESRGVGLSCPRCRSEDFGRMVVAH